MPFPQAYYTASESGLRGIKGFQVQAATPGLAEDSLRVLEQHGAYLPPLSMPLEPTDSQIENVYPISLVYTRPSDQMAALVYSRYVGRDWSGRWGNYFAHGLFIDAPGPSLGFVPIDLWQSAIWQSVPSPASDLPALEDLQIPHRDRSELVRFLEVTDGLRTLPLLMSAVEEYFSSRRRIVLVGDDQTVANWIAVICQLLPSEIAWALTFSTYSRNPSFTDSIITGTTETSGFNLSDFDIKFKYSIFDFVSERFSPLPLTAFSNLIQAELQQGEAKNLLQFSLFVDLIAPDAGIGELATIWRINRLLRHTVVDNAEIPSITRFCTVHASTIPEQTQEEIVAAIATRRPQSAQTLKALASLYSAGLVPASRQAAKTDGMFFEACVDSIPLLDLDSLRSILERFPAHASMQTLAFSRKNHWFNILEACPDLERFSCIARWGDRLGLSEGSEEPLEKLGEDVVGPRLADAASLPSWQALESARFSAALFTGVARYLHSLAKSKNDLLGYTTWIIRPAVQPVLLEFAMHKDTVDLACRIVAMSTAGTPTFIFKKNLDVLRKFGVDGNPTQVEFIFNLVWSRRRMSPQEIDSVLDSLPSKTLDKTFIPEILAHALRTSRAPDEEYLFDPLMRKLLDTFGSSLGDEFIRFSAIEWIFWLRSPEKIPAAQLMEILGETSKFVREDRRKALVLLLDRSFELKASDFRKMIYQASKEQMELLPSAYADAVAQRLGHISRREVVQNIVSGWLTHRNLPEFGPSEASTDKLVFRLFRSLRQQDRDMILADLSKPDRETWEMLASANRDGSLVAFARRLFRAR